MRLTSYLNMDTLITICKFTLLLSRYPSLLGLIPQDLDQLYQSLYALHGNEGLSIVWVQRSTEFFSLLLEHLEFICWAPHSKHHSWSLGTTCYLSCSRKFHDLYNIPCFSKNPWHPLWLSTLLDQTLFHPHMSMEWIKILLACLLELGRRHSIPISSQP